MSDQDTDRPIDEARLREIASGEYGPNRQEGKAMATELIALRAEVAAIAGAAGGDRGSDERLSEYITRMQDRAAIAEGNYGELEALAQRAAWRDHERRVAENGAAPLAQAPVFDGRQGRERGDISDVVASCDPASLVTIKDLALIDEPPGISVGFIIDAAVVRALKERVQEQAAEIALAAAVEGAAQDAVDAGMLDPDWSPRKPDGSR